MKKLTLLGLMLLTLIIIPSEVHAWPQGTHEQINCEAIKKFQTYFSDSEKYQWGPIIKDARYEGLEVVSTSLNVAGYKDSLRSHTYASWIMHGGFSADEPNLYAGVRHFYDPLYLSGTFSGDKVAYLTDQQSLHMFSSLYNEFQVPEINALTWGLKTEENPYSFANGLHYYKMAMSIKESDPVQGFNAADLFRIRPLESFSHKKEREMYLAAAFRALGESMHMMADMAVPAHVRNDGHVLYDPLEERTTRNEVKLLRDEPVDTRIGQYFSYGSGENLYDSEFLFKKLAFFTNGHFYSDDTIYDEASGVMPRNGENPYPSPQFTDLDLSYNQWYGNFNGYPVPMATQSLVSLITSDTVSYNVTPSDAYAQSKVLIPLAIGACTELIDRFFPTLEMVVEAEDEQDMVDQRDRPYVAIPVDVALVHHHEMDPDWSADMAIRYSGPGYVDLYEANQLVDTFVVHFEEGEVVAYQVGNKMVEGPLTFYRKLDAGAKLTKEEKSYEITEDATIIVSAEAGGRLFASEKVDFDMEVLDLTIRYEPELVIKKDEVQFVSDLMEGSYCEWDFGDGNVASGYEQAVIRHTFEEAGDFTVTLKCYDDSNRQVLKAEGEVLVKVDLVFAITFEQGDNFQVEAGQEFELKAVPVNPKNSFDGLNLKWEVEGAYINAPNQEKGYFAYNNPGTYEIILRAYNSDNVLHGEGKAMLEVVEAKTDSRLLEFTQYDRGYFTYDYSKFQLDERPGNVSIQESNYRGGMKLTFYDDANTIIQSVRYYRTAEQVDYNLYCNLTNSQYAGTDFDAYPHVLNELVRSTEWAYDAYDQAGNLIIQEVHQMTNDRVSSESRHVSVQDKSVFVTQSVYYQDASSSSIVYDGPQYFLSVKLADDGTLYDVDLATSLYENGTATSHTSYWYIENYKVLDSNTLPGAVMNYCRDTFRSVDDVSQESNYIGVSDLSPNILINENTSY